MITELKPAVITRKQGLAERLFESRKARERVIAIHEAKCLDIPRCADAALVLGTSLSLFPDKFKKRVFTGSQLQLSGKVETVIFSGESDHEQRNENQSLEARNMAVSQFGVSEECFVTVGGENTMENIIKTREYLSEHEGIKSLFVVSDNLHLIRAFPLAEYEFKDTGIKVYPYPIPGEEELDPNHPLVIREVIKAILYNRVLNKNKKMVREDVKTEIDKIADYYTKLTSAMPRIAYLPFDEWRKKVSHSIMEVVPAP